MIYKDLLEREYDLLGSLFCHRKFSYYEVRTLQYQDYLISFRLVEAKIV